MSWKLNEKTYKKESITEVGNKFLIGNGYMGVRGTLEEYTREYFPAINLSGIYDQAGEAWREPLNAPNGLYTWMEVDGMEYRLPEAVPAKHQLTLDYRHGILERNTVFATEKGTVKLSSKRFASMDDFHLLAMEYGIEADFDCDITIFTGIDGEIWDMNGPHYDSISFHMEEQKQMGVPIVSAEAVTHENRETVAVAELSEHSMDGAGELIKENNRWLRSIPIHAEKDRRYHLYKYVAVYTSRDVSHAEEAAVNKVRLAKKAGFPALIRKHTEVWEKLWNVSEIRIEGDSKAMEAVNYSLYHLHSIAPRYSKSMSIAARGLSGQTYKGAVFWDTEMFMLDFFLYTEPEVARTLLKYRIDTLEGARKKAADYGYEGAFYAWESQEGGYDACSDYNVTDVFTGRPLRTYFKDKQVHISAAVVYGIKAYAEYTGDTSILEGEGAKTVIECAKFYYSLLLKRVNGTKYGIHDVIGPDEYHERVNNNAYTNRMAKMVMEYAQWILEQSGKSSGGISVQLDKGEEREALIRKFGEGAQLLYQPLADSQTGIIEQFDGYMQLEDVTVEEVRSRLLHEKEYWGGAYGVASQTKVIKQADVVTMLTLFSEEYSEAVLQKNLDYYEPRTEHGSSLSACMYALLHCRCRNPEAAYPFFMKSAMADLSGGGKEWAGLIYIGGTHPAAAGGAYMTAVNGFGGFRIKDGEIKPEPRLPDNWKSLTYKVRYKEKTYEIHATNKEVRVSAVLQI